MAQLFTLILILFSTLANAAFSPYSYFEYDYPKENDSGYLTSQISINDNGPLPQPYILSTINNPDEYLPLFTQTCDNIAYSGIIENQAISILTDVKNFVKKLTDPVVEINKFEAGIFLFSFTSCMGIELSKAFDASCEGSTTTDGQDPGSECIATLLLEALSEVSDLVTLTAGMQGSSSSTGGATQAKTNISEETSKSVTASLMEKLLDGGIFEKTLSCTLNKRTEILKWLHNIFEKNFKLKTSVINSIDAQCKNSLRRTGDPQTWSEIYKLNMEMLGTDPDGLATFAEGVSTEVIDGQSPGASQSLQDLDANFSQCIDGLGADNCLTASQKLTLEYLASTTPVSTIYDTKKAYKITRSFFDENGDLKPIYNNSQLLSKILTDQATAIVPQSESDPLQLNINDKLHLPKIQHLFWSLKQALMIDPSSDLADEINAIFYQITSPTFSIVTPDNKTLPKDIPFPLVNPFNLSFLTKGNTAPPLNLIIAKSTDGRFLSISDPSSIVNTKSLVGFYRGFIESLLYELIPDTGTSRVDALSLYKNNQLILLTTTYDTLVDALEAKITTNSTYRLEDIIGNDNIISASSYIHGALIEEELIKIYAMQLLLKELFNSPELPRLKITIHPDINYSIISTVKDYTLPRNIIGKGQSRLYNLVRIFYQSLLIQLTQNLTHDRAILSANKFSQFGDISAINQKINLLSKKTALGFRLQKINNASVFNTRE